MQELVRFTDAHTWIGTATHLPIRRALQAWPAVDAMINLMLANASAVPGRA